MIADKYTKSANLEFLRITSQGSLIIEPDIKWLDKLDDAARFIIVLCSFCAKKTPRKVK